MRIIIVENYEEMSIKAASIVKSQVILKPVCVLGCATGQTPLGTYRELIKAYQNKEVDFAQVTFFNLDEYCKIEKHNPQSYHYYMKENFFNHIHAKKNNTFIPDGMALDMDAECKNYDQKIREYGGIDLQILGIGGNGHIGFNEPSACYNPQTHVIELTEETIADNARYFESKSDVPVAAVTMGIEAIMKAKRVVLLASGKGKADAIYKTIKGGICPQVPASILQLHPDAIFVIDKDAAALL